MKFIKIHFSKIKCRSTGGETNKQTKVSLTKLSWEKTRYKPFTHKPKVYYSIITMYSFFRKQEWLRCMNQRLNLTWNPQVRVANVVAHHDKLLTQWRYTWMSKLRTNIFSIATTSNYLWSSVVGVVKVDYFDFSCKKIEILVWIRC